MPKEKLVKRNQKVAYMNVSTTEIPNFQRMRKFTEISTSKNAVEYSRTYVDEDGETTDITGYGEEKSYAFDQYTNNPVHQKIVDITENEKTDDDALVKVLVVDKTQPVGTGFKARLRTYAVVPDTDGDATEAYTYSGTLKRNSKYTVGVATLSADEKTATFVAESEEEEYPVTFVVKDSTGPVEGAVITVDGTMYVTDATGIVAAYLTVKNYTGITVSKEGYTTLEDQTLNVEDKAALKEITITKAA